jgi:diketogulonate reductase-like aldo/keto reductase
MSATFAFNVKGQQGSIPQLALGTATLFGDTCAAAVREAIRQGYRHFDTALLYDNQEAVGRGIREAIEAGEVTREELFVTTKCAFYPAGADAPDVMVHIKRHQENEKGLEVTRRAIENCLSLLGLDYVDLMLIHNPCTTAVDYQASTVPHCFELGKGAFTQEERDLVTRHRLARANAAYDEAAAEAARAASWKALEQARAAGKVRFIGVSNYPVRLLKAMDAYADVLPAVNQLELHPRFSSPALRALAAERGFVLTGYGSGNSVAIENSPVVAAIANARGESPLATVLRWTLQRGVSVVPRTANPAHMAENLRVAVATAKGESVLAAAELATLDALDQAHPYYWHPLPLLPPGSPPDVGAGLTPII